MNPDTKTPLVVSFPLGFFTHFSPLAAFRCQGSSKDSHYSLDCSGIDYEKLSMLVTVFKIWID